MQTKPRIFSLAQFSLSCYVLTMGVTLASNGVYITPDNGTYQVGDQVALSASRGNGQQGPEGQPCCGDSGNGTYEFYDLSNLGWTGDVVNPSGDHANLDTTTPGQKTVHDVSVHGKRGDNLPNACERFSEFYSYSWIYRGYNVPRCGWMVYEKLNYRYFRSSL